MSYNVRHTMYTYRVIFQTAISVPKRNVPNSQSRLLFQKILLLKKGRNWLLGGFLFGTEKSPCGSLGPTKRITNKKNYLKVFLSKSFSRIRPPDTSEHILRLILSRCRSSPPCRRCHRALEGGICEKIFFISYF